MLQCVLCEDWFHENCIGPAPREEQFEDFICKTCVSAHKWLLHYAPLSFQHTSAGILLPPSTHQRARGFDFILFS